MEKLNTGALRVRGRIFGLAANQEGVPKGKAIISISIVGEEGHADVLKIMVPEKNAWRLVGHGVDINILPKHKGEPVAWIAEETE